METAETASARARDIVRDVLVEAFGASATPFVPVPFVDDWMFARLLRRIAGKVLARHELTSPPELPKMIVFALAVDIAATHEWLHEERVGAAIYRTLRVVGSGAIDSLGRASRDAFSRGGAAQLSAAIGAEVERTRAQLEPALRRELQVP